MDRPVTLEELVGANLRRWRQLKGRSIEQFASEAQWWGLPWIPSTVGKVERGERTLQAAELVLLSQCVKGLDNLLNGDETLRVALTDQTTLELRDMKRALAGRLAFNPDAPVTRDADASDEVDIYGFIDEVILNEAHSPEDAARRDHERRLAKTLGVAPLELAKASFRLWGHGLTEEREHRLKQAGTMTPRTKQALRGHLTRELKDEIIAELGLES